MRVFVVFSACLLAASAATADAPKRVAVLYFDNNTKNRDYDVLQKGLADMLVTDLSAVESLQVVEREKLQSLIEELKLQKSRYFDPATAQKLGKVAGAEYAVTGAFAELDPKMRIDVRLIEVATAKVIVADKVFGEKDKFFDLQQELVDRFIVGLNVKLKASARAKSGVTDVDNLLKYSKGVDAADKGDLKAASAAMAEVVRDAPDFKLAQARYAVFLKRLEEAGKKRSGILSALEEEQLKACEERTAPGVKAALPPGPSGENEDDFNKRLYANRDKLTFHFACRGIKTGLYLSKVMQRLPQGGNSMTGATVLGAADRAEVQQFMTLYYAATEALIADYKALLAQEPRLEFKNLYGLPTPEDKARLEKLNITWAAYLYGESVPELERDLANFALTGKSPNGKPAYFNVRPTLAEMDKAISASAMKHLESALKGAAKEKKPEIQVNESVAALDAYGEALLLLGRKEEAVARWQQVLDGYPTHTSYKEIEKKVKEVICATPDCQAFETALKTCDGSLMMKSYSAMPRVARVEGAAGVRRVFQAVKTVCPKTDPNYPTSPYNVTQLTAMMAVATTAQGMGDCKLFSEARQWLIENNGKVQADTMANWNACQ
jgi:TolB-like protein